MKARLRGAVRAWSYRLGPGQYYQPAYQHIAQSLGMTEGAFLDVGCGPGWLSIHVASGYPELDAVAIDTSPEMVAFAKNNTAGQLNVTVREMDATRIVYPSETFQVAAAVQSAHHWTDTSALLEEVYRVLAPGGRFLIYEADSELTDVPQGWIRRVGMWPPDAWLTYNWRRYGMGAARWEQLKQAVQQSSFGGGEEGRHGFYRRLVGTR